MIEIELFFKTVESEIRRKHVKYLKKQKCLPSDQAEPKEQEGVPADKADEFIYADKPKLREKAKRVKAFNKGIETALKALQSEYKTYSKRMAAEKAGGKKY